VLRVVLDDPRLTHARELERAKDWSNAARAIHEARPSDLASPDRCAWDFVEGRLLLQAGSLPEADAAFVRADDPACPLGPWARDEVRLVIAESLAAKGDRAGALPIWRTWLAANPHGSRWVDTSVRIANAVLDGVDGPAESHAREAYDAATRVVAEAPKLAETSGATAARSRAVALLRAHDPTVTEALGDDLRAKQAQAWLDGGEPAKAFDLASAIVGSAKGGAVCRAAITRANAASKAKGTKGDAWQDAVKACEKDEQLVTALYSGAKARASKDPKLAIDWFGRVEKLFPAHRLADDSRYRAALLVAQSADEGHEQRAEQMLRTLPDTYPSGDMGTEALFHLALDAMKRGAWDSAKPLLDRIVELAPDDHHWATAGRAEYFRARAAAATNDPDDARARYAKIVARYPLAFYMLLAHGRLAAENRALADRTMKEAVARDSGGVFPATEHPELSSPAAQRAMRLLEVGEIDAARRELATAGAVGDGVDGEVLWIVGSLYNQAGAPELGHAFSRGRLTDFLSHYPEGKWRIPWQVAYPRAFEPILVKACATNTLPTPLAWAIMREESSFVADARSHSNAIGLMQLVGPTARWVAAGTTFASDETALKKPEVSIELGVRLLAKLRTTHGHPALAIGAYNGGSGAVERWMSARSGDDLDLFVELIPYDETRNYVKRVLSSQAAYAYLYDPSTLAEPLELPQRFTR
jgi:soluble lytic murein transglycosylase